MYIFLRLYRCRENENEDAEMGFLANNARLLTLTMRENQVQYQMTMLSMQIQKLADNHSTAMTNKTNFIKNFLANNKNTEDSSVSLMEACKNSPEYLEYEQVIDEREAAQDKLDREQARLETENQQVTKERENVDKLVGSNVEESFKYFQ